MYDLVRQWYYKSLRHQNHCIAFTSNCNFVASLNDWGLTISKVYVLWLIEQKSQNGQGMQAGIIPWVDNMLFIMVVCAIFMRCSIPPNNLSMYAALKTIKCNKKWPHEHMDSLFAISYFNKITSTIIFISMGS